MKKTISIIVLAALCLYSCTPKSMPRNMGLKQNKMRCWEPIRLLIVILTIPALFASCSPVYETSVQKQVVTGIYKNKRGAILFKTRAVGPWHSLKSTSFKVGDTMCFARFTRIK